MFVRLRIVEERTGTSSAELEPRDARAAPPLEAGGVPDAGGETEAPSSTPVSITMAEGRDLG